MRRAAEIVDEAFLEIREEIRPAAIELQVAARLNAIMAEHGGEEAAIRTMVSAGPLVWCKTHAAPGHRPIEAGDTVYLDACGVYKRYHVDLCRTVAVGTDHPGARAILEQTAGSVVEVQKACGPATRSTSPSASRRTTSSPASRASRSGGSAATPLGLALPPDWVGHTYLSNDAYEQFTWEPGYVTNYENICFDRDGGFTASYMETLLMTETGIEILSKVPRELHVVGV